MPLKLTNAELLKLQWIQGQMALEGKRLSLEEIAKITGIGRFVTDGELTEEQREALKHRDLIPASLGRKRES